MDPIVTKVLERKTLQVANFKEWQEMFQSVYSDYTRVTSLRKGHVWNHVLGESSAAGAKKDMGTEGHFVKQYNKWIKEREEEVLQGIPGIEERRIEEEKQQAEEAKKRGWNHHEDPRTLETYLGELDISIDDFLEMSEAVEMTRKEERDIFGEDLGDFLEMGDQ